MQNEKYNFSSFLESRTRTILLPFFIYGIILIVLRHIITFNEEISWEQDCLGFIKQIRGENDELWFLAAIWVFGIIFYWMLKLTKKDKELLTLSLSLFIINCIYIYWFHGKMLYWHIGLIGWACFYMCLGKLYKKYEIQFDKIINKKILLLCILIYITFNIITPISYSYTGSKYMVDSIFITTLGLTILIYLCKYNILDNKLFMYIGSNSLLYFIVHGKIISLLQAITRQIMEYWAINNATFDLILGFIITIITGVLAIIPIFLINKYLPMSIGKGFKLW